MYMDKHCVYGVYRKYTEINIAVFYPLNMRHYG